MFKMLCTRWYTNCDKHSMDIHLKHRLFNITYSSLIWRSVSYLYQHYRNHHILYYFQFFHKAICQLRWYNILQHLCFRPNKFVYALIHNIQPDQSIHHYSSNGCRCRLFGNLEIPMYRWCLWFYIWPVENFIIRSWLSTKSCSSKYNPPRYDCWI